jgi:hypothetical protein
MTWNVVATGVRCRSGSGGDRRQGVDGGDDLHNWRPTRDAMGDGLSRRDDDVGDAMERRAVMMCRMASAALRPCR